MDRIVHPFHFISRLGFDSAPSEQRLTSFLDVYYTDNIQYITLSTPPPPHNSPHRYDFTGLTPNDYMDMDLGPIFGLNSHFGVVLGRIPMCFPHCVLSAFAEQLSLSKSN